MERWEKIVLLESIVGTKTYQPEILDSYLLLAAQAILRRAYPYDRRRQRVPPEYESLQCEIAAYMLNRRGSEGQLTHSENGISRSYENADIPNSLLSRIVPRAGVL